MSVDVYIDKILTPYNVFFSKKSYKYFTSYRNDDDKIKSLLYV